MHLRRTPRFARDIRPKDGIIFSSEHLLSLLHTRMPWWLSKHPGRAAWEYPCRTLSLSRVSGFSLGDRIVESVIITFKEAESQHRRAGHRLRYPLHGI